MNRTAFRLSTALEQRRAAVLAAYGAAPATMWSVVVSQLERVFDVIMRRLIDIVLDARAPRLSESIDTAKHAIVRISTVSDSLTASE